MKLVNEYLRESFRKILPFLLPNRSKEEKTGSEKSQGWEIYCLLSGLYRDLRQRGIEVIVHVILGLPGEAPDDMVETVRYVCSSGATGIKLQLLHILKETDPDRTDLERKQKRNMEPDPSGDSDRMRKL